jgi:hypothetical protein
MELVPKIGIGLIRFEMSPSQVEEILGSHHTYENWMDGNLNDALLYPGLVICFDRNNAAGPLPDSRICEIWIHPNSSTTLEDKNIFSLHEKDIESYLAIRDVHYEKNETLFEDDLYFWIPDYKWEISVGRKDKQVNYMKIFAPEKS